MKKHVRNMRKANRFFITIFFLLTVCALNSWAQTACTQTLRQARSVFDEGRIHELEELLSSCIKSGFNDEERTEAYRLLILAHIYLDETEKADAAMLALLKDNHGFTINEKADPSELINLYRTFRTDPIFRLGGKLGGNMTFVNTQNVGGLNNLNNETGGNISEYKAHLGFLIGISADIPLYKNLTINSELSYSRNSFENTNNLYFNADGSVASNNIFIENQNWTGFQTLLQYRVLKSKINPFIALGGGVDYLLSDQIIATREVLNEQPVKESSLDIKAGRNTLNYYVCTSLGIKSKFNSGIFVLEAKFKYGLANMLNSKNILDAVPEYIFDYYGSYNEFSTSIVEFSVGYLVDIYKPIKLKK